MAPVVGPMNEYWNNLDSKRITMGLIRNIFIPFGPNHISRSGNIWPFVPFALLGFYSLIRAKHKIACASALALGLLFFAVLIGKWPMTARLWLFLPAVVLIFFPFGFDFIAKRYKTLAGVGFWVLSVIVIYQLAVISCFGYKKEMYVLQQEVNPLILYVRENIKDGEKLYLYPNAIYTFRFKNGYNAAKIGNVTEDNIIFGKDQYEWREEKLGNELYSILENDNGVYLLFQHHHRGIDGGLKVLSKYGKITQIWDVKKTPLFYFQKTVKKQPSQVPEAAIVPEE
jgi:hypothetical protein